MIGRDKNEVVNEDLVEFPKSNDPSAEIDSRDNEPEVLGRQVRVSRNVEEHELENVLRALPQHGSKMMLSEITSTDIEEQAMRLLRTRLHVLLLNRARPFRP